MRPAQASTGIQRRIATLWGAEGVRGRGER